MLYAPQFAAPFFGGGDRYEFGVVLWAFYDMALAKRKVPNRRLST